MSKRAPTKQLDRFSVDNDDDFGEQEPQHFQSGKADWKADQKELTARSFSIPKGRGSAAAATNPFASFAVPAVDVEKKKHGLNKSFIAYVNDLYAKNPCVDLRGAFERYSSHWASIAPAENQVKHPENAGKKTAFSCDKGTEKVLDKPIDKPAFTFEKQPIQFQFNQDKPSDKKPGAFVFNQEKAISFSEKPTFSVARPAFSMEKPASLLGNPTALLEKPASTIQNPTSLVDKQAFTFNQQNQPAPLPNTTFTFQTPQEKSSTSAETTSPFKAPTFNLFSNSSSSFSFQPQSFAAAPSSKEDQEENDEDQHQLLDDEPKEHFEPIKPAQEEGKEIIFEKRCKLFLFKDNEYKDKGVSELRLMREIASGKNILLARLEVSGNITLNSMLNTNCKATAPANGKKDVIVLCFDANGKLSNHLLRFKTFEEAQECYEKISSALQ